MVGGREEGEGGEGEDLGGLGRSVVGIWIQVMRKDRVWCMCDFAHGW